MTIALIIPAAGSGSRFGAAVPKQFLDLAGKPVLQRTIEAFVGLVDVVILAADATWEPEVQRIADTSPIPCRVVRGGATRQDSVHAALLATSDAVTAVLVHDAVRPLIPRHCITACLAALAEHPAAVVAVPCAATVKRAAGDGTVDATVPREGLWLAQTPQGFRRDIGLRAFAEAKAAGVQGTDDVQLIERLGLKVALITGDAANLKITTPDDLVVAEAIVRARES